MNWVQFKNLLYYLCLCGTVVSSLSLTHKIFGSNTAIPFDLQYFFVIEFRENIQRKEKPAAGNCKRHTDCGITYVSVIQSQMRGEWYPIQLSPRGVPNPVFTQRVPHPALTGGYPNQADGGTPSLDRGSNQDGFRYSPNRGGWGNPPSGLDGGTPPVDRQTFRSTNNTYPRSSYAVLPTIIILIIFN